MIHTVEITFHDTDISVDYEYDPGEAMVMYYPDGSGHPGAPPSVEIHDIYIGDTNVIDIFDPRLIVELEEKLIEMHE